MVHWFKTKGRPYHPYAKRLMILNNCGRSNSNRARAWRYYLQIKLCDPYQIQVIVAHCPNGANKWNPIEHRLFDPISINLLRRPLDSEETSMNHISTTSNRSGLHVEGSDDETISNGRQNYLRTDGLDQHKSQPSKPLMEL